MAVPNMQFITGPGTGQVGIQPSGFGAGNSDVTSAVNAGMGLNSQGLVNQLTGGQGAGFGANTSFGNAINNLGGYQNAYANPLSQLMGTDMGYLGQYFGAMGANLLPSFGNVAPNAGGQAGALDVSAMAALTPALTNLLQANKGTVLGGINNYMQQQALSNQAQIGAQQGLYGSLLGALTTPNQIIHGQGLGVGSGSPGISISGNPDPSGILGGLNGGGSLANDNVFSGQPGQGQPGQVGQQGQPGQQGQSGSPIAGTGGIAGQPGNPTGLGINTWGGAGSTVAYTDPNTGISYDANGNPVQGTGGWVGNMSQVQQPGGSSGGGNPNSTVVPDYTGNSIYITNGGMVMPNVGSPTDNFINVNGGGFDTGGGWSGSDTLGGYAPPAYVDPNSYYSP